MEWREALERVLNAPKRQVGSSSLPVPTTSGLAASTTWLALEAAARILRIVDDADAETRMDLVRKERGKLQQAERKRRWRGDCCECDERGKAESAGRRARRIGPRT